MDLVHNTKVNQLTYLVCLALFALSLPALIATEAEQQTQDNTPLGALLEAENNGTLNWIIVDSGNTEDGDGGQRTDQESNDGSDKRGQRDGLYLNHSGQTWFAINQQNSQAWLSSFQQDRQWQLKRPDGGFEIFNLISNDRGQVWLVGRFPSRLEWHEHVIHSSGAHDLFVAHISEAGRVEWLRQVGTVGSESLLSAEVQQDGFIHLEIRSILQQGKIMQDSLSVSGSERFSMMMDPKGKLSWVERND